MFYAPHIATLSSTLGIKFQPIRYILDGNSIASNVFYSSSIVQVITIPHGLPLSLPGKSLAV